MSFAFDGKVVYIPRVIILNATIPALEIEATLIMALIPTPDVRITSSLTCKPESKCTNADASIPSPVIVIFGYVVNQSFVDTVILFI